MSQARETHTAKAFRVIAYALVGLAFIYISQALWAYRSWLLDWHASTVDLVLIVMSTVAYGFSGLLLASAWRGLIRICGQGEFSRWQCIAIYGTTQIAKYVPGNVFHFVGRHAAGVRVGIPHAVLVCSASLEMIALLFSASILALSGILIPESGLLALLPFPLWLVIGIVMVGFIAMVYLAPYAMRRFKFTPAITGNRAQMKMLVPVVIRHLLFFMISGLLMATITFVVTGSLSWTTLILAVSSYPVSWLAGYVIPGASAGIGVREATIMLILSTTISAEEATLVAILMRLVTLLGDIFFFLLAKTVESGRFQPG